MIDYWEAIGRLASDAQLNTRFQNLNACGKTRTPTLVYANDGSVAGNGLDIEEKDYNEVQDFIGKVLTEKTLSVIGAGELMWDFSFEQSRQAMMKLNGVVAGAVPGLANPSTAYFIALGKVIVDDTLRKSLTTPGADLSQAFPRLSGVELAAIAALLATAAFIQTVLLFGFLPWKPGCIPGSQFTKGYIQPTGIWATKKSGRLVTNPGGTWSTPAAEYAYK